MDAEGRVCTKCLTYKPWSEYVKSSKTVTGHSSCCKQCKNTAKRALPRKPSTTKSKERSKAYQEHLKKTDPLKKKSQNLRSGMRSRSPKGMVVPTSKEIEAWLKSIHPFVCYYTGVELKKTDFSVDHKQPLDRGGDNSFDNLCICTKQVNTTKGTMTEKEFKGLLKFLDKWEDKGARLLRRLRMAGKAFGK